MATSSNSQPTTTQTRVSATPSSQPGEGAMNIRRIKLLMFGLHAISFVFTISFMTKVLIERQTGKPIIPRQPNRHFNTNTPQENHSVDTGSMSSYFNTERLNRYLQMIVTNDTNFISEKLTTVTISTNQNPPRVGDLFEVGIRLFYTDGVPVETGGDYLRIWLKSQHHPLSNVNGQVIDHGNGSYTGQVLLAWKGPATVTVSVANSRHHIALIMQYIEQHGTLHTMTSKFQDSTGNHEEEVVCSPKQDVVLEGCNFEDRCNSTPYNYGLPWFCCKPKSEFITCDGIKTQASTDTSLISQLATTVSMYQKHLKVADTNLNIYEGENGVVSLSSPSLSCSERAAGVTWRRNGPSGYYYKSKWVNLKCKAENIPPNACLKNKRVVALGDSNSRFIYTELCTKSNAQILTAHYTKEKPWHKLLMAKNVASNLDLMWAPHNPPFYVGPHQGLDTMRSVGNWLDRTPNDKPIVVIIHLYYHLSRTTLSAFRALVKDARAGVDRLLSRAPDTSVVIMGPHAITFRGCLEPLDYLRRCYEEIWFQEFEGLHHKVIYVDNWDRTVGTENVDTHPSLKTMTDVTDEILSYICR